MSSFTSQPPALVYGPRMPIIYGQVSDGEAGDGTRLTIGMIRPMFSDWNRYEVRRSLSTVRRYEENLGWVIRYIGDVVVGELHAGHLMELRRKMEERGCREARMASILNSLRSFLKFCRYAHIVAMDPRQVRIPRIPRRDVVFLTKEEVAQYLDSILDSGENWRTAPIVKLRLRTIAEVLLGTGARMSEILRLTRTDVRFDLKEARTIGKGNKERILFFTDRALEWLEHYLARRQDEVEALFVTAYGPPAPLTAESLKKEFGRAQKNSGIPKKVSAHILRHTMATVLLFNGCPIGHIKELLGHERLDTTCRYYLGLDRRAAKEAHHKFLSYEC